MKKQLPFLFLLALLCLKGQAQSKSPAMADSSYAMIQVLSPQTVFGEFKIKIYYGNNQIEDFKTVEYSKKNREFLNNDITDAINYLQKKGYRLVQSLTYTWSYVEIQYIMQKI